MRFLDTLRRALSGGEPRTRTESASGGDPNGILFYFRCDKCGAPVRVRVDRRSDLNPEDGPGHYVVRKDVMDAKCFLLMKAEIWLDTTYSVVQADVRGGKLITEEEYKASLNPPA